MRASERILTVLDGTPRTPQDVAGLTGLPIRTVWVVLRRLDARGLAQRTGYGVYVAAGRHGADLQADAPAEAVPRLTPQALHRPCPYEWHRGQQFEHEGRIYCMACASGETVQCARCPLPAEAWDGEPVCAYCRAKV
jgi:hypothetical protein